MKVTGRITNDQYVKVTAETTTNFCLVNDSDSSAASAIARRTSSPPPSTVPRPFSAAETSRPRKSTATGGSCLVVARISDYAWEHAAAGTYSDTITFTASLETANAAG